MALSESLIDIACLGDVSKKGNWKGGRTREPRGYILVKVGKSHHLADSRGYAYEHRIVAELKLGRKLTSQEVVHHVDGNKENNHDENLTIIPSPSLHVRAHHPHSKRRLKGQPNPLVACACGCGGKLEQFDQDGRPRSYFPGHQFREPESVRKMKIKNPFHRIHEQRIGR